MKNRNDIIIKVDTQEKYEDIIFKLYINELPKEIEEMLFIELLKSIILDKNHENYIFVFETCNLYMEHKDNYKLLNIIGGS